VDSCERNRSLDDSSTIHRKSKGGTCKEGLQRNSKLGSATRYSMWLITYQLTALSRR